MSKDSLATKVESLASTAVMSAPHDLQAVSMMIKLFEEIAEQSAGELAEVIKPVAKAAVNLAEEMIVQQGEEAAKSMELLGRAVTVFQTALGDGPSAAQKLIPEELGGGLSDSTTLSTNVDEKIFAEFLSRQDSVLEEMESHILAIEKKGIRCKKIGDFKRILHTLKGESGMLGLTDVERVCHETESYLETAQDGNIIDCLLAVKDWLSQSFEACSGGSPVSREAEEIISFLHSESQKTETETESEAESGEKEEKPAELSIGGGDTTLVCDFISESRGHLDNADVQLLTIESDSGDQEALNAVFRSFHTIKGVAGFLDLKDISKLAHAAEDLLDKARKGNLVLSGASIDTIFETVDTLRRLIEQVEGALSSGESIVADPALPGLLSRLKEVSEGGGISIQPPSVHPEKKLGDILIESGKVRADTVEKALTEKDEQTKLGELLVKKGGVPAREVAGALRAQQNARQSLQVKEAVKIDTERLDKLLDAIGELVIAESIVSQDEEILSAASARVTRNLGHLNKITRVVQELGMSMRMVHIRPTFQKMARLVRDLAKKAGKDVEFTTAGEETELDRSVVEKIGDPLVHLIRNAVDHGIEDNGSDRVETGKPATSQVELRAFHQGGSIFIEVEDDGRGLDTESILAKARERGIIQDGSEMSDREIFNLIFAPGFSTAKKITDVSGRGVGMDVVKRNIESLRGNIELMSKPGKGTTVSMRLPLTLAIIDGMIIEVGAERYIIPTLSVVESLRPRQEDISTVVGRGELLSVRGQLMPLYRVSRTLGVFDAIDDPTKGLVMVVEDQGRCVALLVDSLIGQQQVVIKNLGEGMGKVKGISGGAIMADGRVGLILDISELVRMATSSQEIIQTETKEVRMKSGHEKFEDSPLEVAAVL
jgi:two-component system, chemotaxis family, sensor kinase CheA